MFQRSQHSSLPLTTDLELFFPFQKAKRVGQSMVMGSMSSQGSRSIVMRRVIIQSIQLAPILFYIICAV